MKVDIVSFHTPQYLGAGAKFDAFNLSDVKLRPMIASMDYNPETGEVVCETTVRCPLGKGRQLRIPASNVANVWVTATPAKAEAPKKAA